MFNIIDNIIFEKYNEGKLSDDKMILLLEASNTNKEEIKRIKEKIKKKEKLTEAEKKKYEMYKKSRNKKIGIGVGAVAAGIAVKHRLDQLKAKDKALEEEIKWRNDHDEQESKKRDEDKRIKWYGGIDSKIMEQESYIEYLERQIKRANKRVEELSKNKFKNRNTIRNIQNANNSRMQQIEKAKVQISELKKRKK